MTLVPDTSVTMAWLFEDEASAQTDALLDRLLEEAGVAPALWPYEVANSVRMGQRRGRLDDAGALSAIEVADHLPVELVTPPSIEQLHRIAEQFQLTAYDAAYLDLAMRRGLPLATLDRRLRKAAASAGVEVLP